MSNLANLVPFVFSSEVSNTDPEPESLDDNGIEDEVAIVGVDSQVSDRRKIRFKSLAYKQPIDYYLNTTDDLSVRKARIGQNKLLTCSGLLSFFLENDNYS